MNTVWWLSTHRMTVRVAVDDAGIVREAAPIVRKFLGQPSKALGAWLRKQGGFQAAKIGEARP